MASGFQGPGFFDAQGNWVDGIPGQTINSNPINTPNSSTGEPAFAEPSATGWSTEFAQPAGGQLTTTPNSRTGAPAPGIRNVPAVRPPAAARELMPSSAEPMPGWAGPAASALTGGGLWGLGGYLMGKTIEPQPTNRGEDEVLKRFQPAPNTTIGTQTGTAPATQTQPLGQTSPITGGPPPPTTTLPPGYPPLPPPRPPMVQAPIPNFPITGGGPPLPPRRPGAPNLGYGVPQAAAPQAPSSMFTTIDRPNADIVGGPTRPGYLSADPHEPGGPARMGALDLSGLFSHPAVAQAAAQHPAVQGALAHNIATNGSASQPQQLIDPSTLPGRMSAVDAQRIRNPRAPLGSAANPAPLY